MSRPKRKSPFQTLADAVSDVVTTIVAIPVLVIDGIFFD